MSKKITTLPLIHVTLRPELQTPLYRQMYDQLRAAILSGKISPGTRLPSTRTLANELGISRNTVTTAFSQLVAEGYIECRVGSGSYTAPILPEEMRKNNPPSSKPGATWIVDQVLSKRGLILANASVSVERIGNELLPFRAGTPALDKFPFNVWARLEAQFWRSPLSSVLIYSDPAGYRPLREAIALYLQTARAVNCTAEQVMIVNGSQQALYLAGRLLLDPGDSVWIEDPGYTGFRGALIGMGVELVPVPIDSDGLDLAAGIRRNPTAKMICITPSHQFPMGVTMTLQRRLALLNWNAHREGWILEDDYDSEFRYTSRPLASLQGLDSINRVIYVGTLSKVLFPSLRLGYMVIPLDLVPAFKAAHALVDRQSPGPNQVVLARFISEGHFVRYIRRMRKIYASRQEVLVNATRKYLGDLIEIAPSDGGLHLIGWLPPWLDDRIASKQALSYGIEVTPLSAYCVDPYPRQGLILGYAAFDETTIVKAVKQLKIALSALDKSEISKQSVRSKSR